MIKDVREYLDHLNKQGYLDVVEDRVKLSHIPQLLAEQEKTGNAVIFKNIEGYDYPIFNNLFGKRAFLASVFECPIENVVDIFGERMEQRIKPVMVDHAPVHEVVLNKGDFDIRKFPFIVHSAHDVGRYITGGMVIAKDPETGVRNCSFNRMQLKGPDKTGLRMSPTQDLESYYRKAVAMKKPLEIAVVIGSHPMCLLAAACGPARDVDELEIAGALCGEPIPLVKCKTIDMEVPAYAEVVIEGKIMPGEMEDEGPFGDFQEYYIETMKNHIVHFQCLTMRKNPMIQVIRAGSTDDITLLGSPREAQIKKCLTANNVDVRAINIMVCKNYLTCAIAIHKQYEFEVKNALMMAFGSFKFLKNCIIVDEDVNVFDPADLFWAMATRMRPAEGLLVVPNAMGFGRDKYGIHTTKLGIDATAPFNEWQEFTRVTVPAPEDCEGKE
ncbi:UbiD family decarboxylase [Anaerotruncus sp. DFI.9.16]|uniref:UbiD family decarboxylase n=1 Tax=Anaerotruncus sp. DFI.9.16 TaxID=2965275 RepID=UPI00210A6D17|nr:UbiD family decarboxylase [Anaerotruncus sp. DFI.9.16]MCQ4896278.1 UbiD family decarboxylase [Anaerotruncus sp. DFI.9.16]